MYKGITTVKIEGVVGRVQIRQSTNDCVFVDHDQLLIDSPDQSPDILQIQGSEELDAQPVTIYLPERVSLHIKKCTHVECVDELHLPTLIVSIINTAAATIKRVAADSCELVALHNSTIEVANCETERLIATARHDAQLFVADGKIARAELHAKNTATLRLKAAIHDVIVCEQDEAACDFVAPTGDERVTDGVPTT